MKNQYVEMLVKRKSLEGLETIKKVMIGLIVVTLLAGFVMLIPIFFIIAIILALIYYFKLIRLDTEYEYYYMDGELDVAKIINKSKRKNVLSLEEDTIVLIAPCDALEIESYGNLNIIDCSSNDPKKPPYAMICKHKNVLTKVYLQLNESFLKALLQDMPYKVKL